MARKRLLENIFFYYFGFTVVSLFLIISLVIASGQINEGLRNEVETSFTSGVSHVEDLGERLRMLNNVITQDATFTQLVYQSDANPNVAGLRSMNSLYRNLCFIAHDVSYIFTLFSSSDLFLSSGDASFSFDDYYNSFMAATIDGQRIESAQELRDFIYTCFSQRRHYIRLDSFYCMTGSAFELYENPIMILQSNSAYSTNPQYVTAYIVRTEDLKNLLLQGYFPDVSRIGIEYANGDPLLELDVDDGNWYITRRNSANLGFTISLAIPDSYFKQEISSVIWLLRMVIVGGIMSGIVFSLFYGIRRYRGFKSLFSALEGEMSPAKGSFADVREGIVSLRNEAGEVERQKRTIQFESILTKGIQNSADLSFITALVDFAPKGYLVLVARFFQDEEGREARGLFNALENSGYSGTLNVHTGSDDEIFVVPLENTDLERTVELVQSWLNDNPLAIVHIGISPVSFDISEIPTVYSKASSALYSLYMYENENALLCYEEGMRTSLLENLGLEKLLQLRNILLRSQRAEAIAWFEEVCAAAESNPLEAQERKSQFVFILLNVFEEVWTTLSIPERPWAAWRKDMTIVQLQDAFISLIDELCSYTSSVKKSHNNELLERLLDLISLGYKSPGFSAYGLSRQAGISEKYMQSFFREQMGVSFSQYLQSLRLEKAKELLETTDWTNEKIAQETGFGSLNTFYRNFSKYYGITPKVFKEGLAKN